MCSPRPRRRIRSRPTSTIAAGRKARTFANGRDYFGIKLPLGPELGGPLFFAHYSFLGLDPRGLSDRYADYFAQNVAQTLHQPGALHRQSRRLQGLRPGLLGPDGERHVRRLHGAFAAQRPRRHLAHRRPLLHALRAGGKPAGAPLFLIRSWATASSANTASATPSLSTGTGSQIPIWRSTRARSSR